MNERLLGAHPPLSSSPSRLRDDFDLKNLANHNRRMAFEALNERYRPRLYRYALHLLNDPQEANDVAQETLLKAYLEPAIFTDSFNIRPWLFRVTTNLCYNLTRNSGRRRALLQETLSQDPGDLTETSDTLIHEEMLSQVRQALSAMSDRDRHILELRYYRDLSYLEISDHLSCPIGTVMSRLSRARDRLHDVMSARLLQ